MIISRKICPPGLKNNPNKYMPAIKFITIHETGNYRKTADAKRHAVYIYNGSCGSKISWHFTCDSNVIVQHFEDNQACWHAGDGSGPGNMSSISIEICVNSREGFKQACQNAAWLTAHLIRKHNLGIDAVVQHNKWNGKNCPAELRSGVWGISWADFLEMVRENLEPKPLYRVQIGAYSTRAKAEEVLVKLKAAGFSGAIIKR
jgi:N-acetylmuramoyl-L-alanine amidase